MPAKKKPVLIQCGKHLININDVRSISEVRATVEDSEEGNLFGSRTRRKKLYIVKFISDPNPEYPIWINEENIGSLLKHFRIER